MTKRQRDIRAIWRDFGATDESLKACARRLARIASVEGLICKIWLSNKLSRNST